MDWIALKKELASPEVDVDRMAAMTQSDPEVCRQMVDWMLDPAEIMVYYHAFYALDRACQSKPEVLIAYRESIASLLDHPNSYHRDFALTLLANLAGVDADGFTERILPAYLEHLHDRKFMTAHCCLRSLGRIFLLRPDLAESIGLELLAFEQGSPYSSGQTALMMADVLAIFDQASPAWRERAEVRSLVLAQRESPSPKTRKLAREISKRWGI
jgi:hypothetical protein